MLAHHYLQALELTAAAGGGTASFADAARAALTHAGERAFALNAYEAAARFFRAALDLVSERDVHRGRLLFRLGRTLFLLGESGAEVLELARDELAAAGDIEGAADTEKTLCEHFWLVGERDLAVEHLDSARELVAELDPSPVKARVIEEAARLMMLSGQVEEAIRLGEEAIAMADQLGLDDIRAAAMVDVGTARSDRGDEMGMAILRQAIEPARAANAAFDLCRAIGNLAAFHWTRGELEEAGPLRLEAAKVAEEYGQRGFARWFRGLLLSVEYERGQWSEGLARADAFVEEVEAGAPHYLAAQAYLHRALIRQGRDELEGLAGDIERGLALAERARDPQTLYPSLAMAAHILLEQGDRERALPLANDLLSGVEESTSLGFGLSFVHFMALVLAALDRGPAAAAVLEPYGENVWARAGIAVARDDFSTAADVFAAIGAWSSEAYCRLAAARMLVAEGRRAEADKELARALSFYRSVEAKRYVRMGESLLAVSA